MVAAGGACFIFGKDLCVYSTILNYNSLVHHEKRNKNPCKIRYKNNKNKQTNEQKQTKNTRVCTQQQKCMLTLNP